MIVYVVFEMPHGPDDGIHKILFVTDERAKALEYAEDKWMRYGCERFEIKP